MGDYRELDKFIKPFKQGPQTVPPLAKLKSFKKKRIMGF